MPVTEEKQKGEKNLEKDLHYRLASCIIHLLSVQG